MKKAIAVAQRGLDEAQQKLEAGNRWIHRIEKESFDFKGAIQGLANALEQEIPNARTRIDGMIEALEAYFDTTPASALTASDSAESLPDMRRSEPEEQEEPEVTAPANPQEDKNERQ